jgi:hypothetical protein
MGEVSIHRWVDQKVVFDVADDAYVDVERHVPAALMRDGCQASSALSGYSVS